MLKDPAESGLPLISEKEQGARLPDYKNNPRIADYDDIYAMLVKSDHRE
jgi:hypothetical protein